MVGKPLSRLGIALMAMVSVVGYGIVIGSGTAASGATGLTSSAPGVTPTTITIGLVETETGPEASSFSDSAGGIEARFALQNAQGGVNGRKLKLVVKDDQSSPTVEGDASLALAPSTFGIIESSAIDGNLESGNKVLAPLGVPVTEWGADTVDSNSFSPLYPNTPTAAQTGGITYYYDYVGPFFKSIGVKKLALIAPAGAASPNVIGAQHEGIAYCYSDLSAPIGGTDFTVQALAIQKAGCGGTFTLEVDSSDVAFAQAMKNAGSKIPELFETGYDQSVLEQPSAKAALNGDYIANQVDLTNPNPATQVMLNTIKKYDHEYSGGLPDFGTWTSYMSADLMIKGLELAGTNPTRKSFISNLRKVSSYNAGGIDPNAFNFTHFGTVAALPKTDCWYFLQLKGNAYVSANHAKPICGKLYSTRL